MNEPLAYRNGQLLPAAELTVPVWDTGFVQGVTVAEQLRTFGGQLFALDRHLQRLAQSLRVIELDPGLSWGDLEAAAVRLSTHNHGLLAPGDDLGLSILVTPGPYAAFAPSGVQGPLVAMHTYPLAFRGFADKYQRGERLATTAVQQVPGACWPTSLKCRSRMHYYLADRQARRSDPQARALMLDQDGFVTEASTANVILYRKDTGFISPPQEKILPGVSVATLQQLAPELGIPFVFQEVTVEDVLRADEVLLSSTSPCLLPVVALNGQPIGTGQPGSVFQRAIAAWSRLVGVDIVQQASQFAAR